MKLHALKDWAGQFTDVRRDEYPSAALMALYGYLVMTSYYVIKAVRNSVFVDRVGAQSNLLFTTRQAKRLFGPIGVLEREGFARLMEKHQRLVGSVVTYLTGVIRDMNEGVGE